MTGVVRPDVVTQEPGGARVPGARLTVTGWSAASRAADGGPGDDRFGADGTLFSVADGLGGLPAGGRAAAAAVAALHAAAPADGDGLAAALFSANNAVRALALDLGHPTGTTLTALLVTAAGAWVVHAGDTRAWLSLDGAPPFAVTSDDNVAAALGVGSGDSRYRRLGAQLTLHLGAEPVLERPAVALPPVRRRARVLLSSDGVHDVLPAELVARIVLAGDDPGEVAARLVRAAGDGGTQDDATAVVVDLGVTPGDPGPVGGGDGAAA